VKRFPTAIVKINTPYYKGTVKAQLIYRLRRSEHITDTLLSLHWLRVWERIEYRVQSCRAHVQGLKQPRAAVPVVGFHPCCWRAVSTPTPLGVHRPVAGAVLPAVNDRMEGVPHRWCTCLERSSLWRYVCPLTGRLWMAFKDRTFSPLLQRCL